MTENVEHLEGGEWLRAANPAEFRTLAEAEPAMPRGGHTDHLCFLCRFCRGFRKQTIAFADEQVTGIQRYRHAILLVQRLLAIALGILVLDIVMDQRGFMKALDGYGDFAESAGKGASGISRRA